MINVVNSAMLRVGYRDLWGLLNYFGRCQMMDSWMGYGNPQWIQIEVKLQTSVKT